MLIESVAIDSLIPDPSNARTHDEKNLAAIKGSLAKFGQRKNIVTRNNIVLAGNGTLAAAKSLGWTKINIVRADDMTATEAAAFALADNRSSELAEWDVESLQDTLKGLQLDDFDLNSIGFDDADLATFLPEPETPGLTDEDEVPENVETRCKPGDLWQLGNHRLLCGDSTNVQHVERLMNGEKADMVFTDPPYGVSFVGMKGSMYSGGKKIGKNTSDEIVGDDIRGYDLTSLFRDSLALAAAVSDSKAPFYVFFAINRSEETLPAISDCGLTVRNWLIWDKGNVGFHAMGAQYKPNFESFLYAVRESPEWAGDFNQQTIWRHSAERLGLHPTMKPVELVAQAIRNHNSKSLLDLFLGSGSTLIACEKTNRKCYGMEIDPHYCSVILERWEKFTGKTATLVEASQ